MAFKAAALGEAQGNATWKLRYAHVMISSKYQDDSLLSGKYSIFKSKEYSIQFRVLRVDAFKAGKVSVEVSPRAPNASLVAEESIPFAKI